jgi:hypothetical protein
MQLLPLLWQWQWPLESLICGLAFNVLKFYSKANAAAPTSRNDTQINRQKEQQQQQRRRK